MNKATELFEPLYRITDYIRIKGKRYTFWYLTEVCHCSKWRAVYLIILAM